MHRATLAPAASCFPTQQLGHTFFRVETLGNADAVAAVGAGHGVVLAQGEDSAHIRRFLPDAGMQRAAQFAFHRETHCPLLETADKEHGFVHAQ